MQKVAPGKLYVKTHGCQMNEYDSARMADVLAAINPSKTTTPDNRNPDKEQRP